MRKERSERHKFANAFIPRRLESSKLERHKAVSIGYGALGRIARHTKNPPTKARYARSNNQPQHARNGAKMFNAVRANPTCPVCLGTMINASEFLVLFSNNRRDLVLVYSCNKCRIETNRIIKPALP